MYFTLLYCTTRYGTVLYRTVLCGTAPLWYTLTIYITLNKCQGLGLYLRTMAYPVRLHVFMTHYVATELPNRSLPATPMRFPWTFNTLDG